MLDELRDMWEKATEALIDRWVILTVICLLGVVFWPKPASSHPATTSYANIVFHSGKRHIFIQNEGTRTGSIVVARKVTVFYPDGTRRAHRLPRQIITLQPGERQRLQFSFRRPEGVKRVCKSAGEVGVGSEAVVCTPRVKRR